MYITLRRYTMVRSDRTHNNNTKLKLVYRYCLSKSNKALAAPNMVIVAHVGISHKCQHQSGVSCQAEGEQH